jgi:phytoene synthase
MASDKALFDKVSFKTSRLTARSYSTTFSIGIRCLEKRLRNPIYSIYGFVRFADEIVDTFHEYDKASLLKRFKTDTWRAIDEGISLNPILNSFQATVHNCGIEKGIIEQFLSSMEMDLVETNYTQEQFEKYILGSAEVVGLMCLRVFCQGREDQYQKLKWPAMKLGSAFQKVNFLRDLRDDYSAFGRGYFPGIDAGNLDAFNKKRIEESIEDDFKESLEGIRQLPRNARLGVYVSYLYYRALFKKIKNLLPSDIMRNRVRIRNSHKLALLGYSYVRDQFNML